MSGSFEKSGDEWPLADAEAVLAERGEWLAWSGMSTDADELRVYQNPETMVWTLAYRPPYRPGMLRIAVEGNGGKLEELPNEQDG